MDKADVQIDFNANNCNDLSNGNDRCRRHGVVELNNALPADDYANQTNPAHGIVHSADPLLATLTQPPVESPLRIFAGKASPGRLSSLRGFLKICRSVVGRLIRRLFSPCENHDNIILLGGKRCVEVDRKQIQASKYVIHPLSKFRQYWDIFVIVVVLLNLLLVPMDITYDIHKLACFLSIADIVCITDILLTFRTGYRADNRVSVAMKSFELGGTEIARHYLKTGLPIDLVSAVPFHYIIVAFYGEHETHGNGVHGTKTASDILKFLKLLKLVNLLKLLRLSRVIRGLLIYEDVHRITAVIMRYIRLIGMILLLAHWNGCLQFIIPMLKDFPDGSWVGLRDLQTKPWYEQYSWSLLKALSHMLTTGYGGAPPAILYEAMVTIFTMVTGVTCYTLFIAHSLNVMVRSDYSVTAYLEKIRTTNNYLHCRNVPVRLLERVDLYFHQKYAYGRYFNERQLLSEISPPIRNDIIRHTSRDIVDSIPFLQYLPSDCVLNILQSSLSDIYLAGDIINQGRNLQPCIYYVRRGMLDISIEGVVVGRLHAGDFFDEHSILLDGKRLSNLYTAAAFTASEVVRLPAYKIKLALSENLSLKLAVEYAVIKRLTWISQQCRHGFSVVDDSRDDYDESSSTCRFFEKYLEFLSHRIVECVDENDENSSSRMSLDLKLRECVLWLAQSHYRSHTSCSIISTDLLPPRNEFLPT